MDPNEKELLKRNLALSEDNNDILRSMRRSMRWSQFMTFVYWVIIIGISVGAYIYLQPYFDQFIKFYNQAKTELNSVNTGINSVKQKFGQ